MTIDGLHYLSSDENTSEWVDFARLPSAYASSILPETQLVIQLLPCCLSAAVGRAFENRINAATGVKRASCGGVGFWASRIGGGWNEQTGTYLDGPNRSRLPDLDYSKAAVPDRRRPREFIRGYGHANR